MALRAGYHGLKRFERNKLLDLAASIPADIGPDNPIASKSDISATVDLLKDTTGWLGKQRLPFPYKDGNSKTMNGITYTVDSEGVVDINGTATGGNSLFNLSGEYGVPDSRVSALRGNYVLDVTNPVPANSNIAISIRKSDNETLWSITNEQKKIEVDFTEQLHAYGWIYIFVPNGTEVSHYKVKPLLTEKSIYDISPAYEPYHESVEDWYWSENAKTGVHNFVLGGLSGYSIGDQGNIYADATYDLHFGIVTQGESYTVTTDDSAGFVGGYFTSMPTSSSVTYNSSRVVSANKTFTAPIDGYVVFRTTHNYAIPMFCLADDSYDGYTKGAMTNRELTEKVTVKSDSITSSFTANGDVANGLTKIGEIVFIDAAYKEVTASQWDVIATIPAGFRPKTPCRLLDGFGKKSLVINANGDIQAAESISNTYVYIHDSWITQDSDPAPANREISAEPEVKETKKAAKKKVIKEEEE